jgi:hypothetical protein
MNKDYEGVVLHTVGDLKKELNKYADNTLLASHDIEEGSVTTGVAAPHLALFYRDIFDDCLTNIPSAIGVKTQFLVINSWEIGV